MVSVQQDKPSILFQFCNIVDYYEMSPEKRTTTPCTKTVDPNGRARKFVEGQFEDAPDDVLDQTGRCSIDEAERHHQNQQHHEDRQRSSSPRFPTKPINPSQGSDRTSFPINDIHQQKPSTLCHEQPRLPRVHHQAHHHHQQASFVRFNPQVHYGSAPGTFVSSRIGQGGRTANLIHPSSVSVPLAPHFGNFHLHTANSTMVVDAAAPLVAQQHHGQRMFIPQAHGDQPGYPFPMTQFQNNSAPANSNPPTGHPGGSLMMSFQPHPAMMKPPESPRPFDSQELIAGYTKDVGVVLPNDQNVKKPFASIDSSDGKQEYECLIQTYTREAKAFAERYGGQFDAKMISHPSAMLLPSPHSKSDYSDSCPEVKPDWERENGVRHGDYLDSDVLFGRGASTNTHVGNLRFRDLISKYRLAYCVAPKGEKGRLVRNLCAYVRKNGARFLGRDDDDGNWYEVGDERACAKVSQSLREGSAAMVRQTLNNSRGAAKRFNGSLPNGGGKRRKF